MHEIVSQLETFEILMWKLKVWDFFWLIDTFESIANSSVK
jgi:hypothetical protein